MGVQRIAQRTLQPASVHTVIRLQMPDGRLDGMAPSQPRLLLRVQALELAAVDDVLAGVGGADAPEARIRHHDLECNKSWPTLFLGRKASGQSCSVPTGC
jgi:hypothetical protein